MKALGRFPAWLRLLTCLMVLQGCAAVAPYVPSMPSTPVSPAPDAPPVRPADQRAAMPAALSTERQWLQSWFDGTPVSISQGDDGSLAIEVPSEHCFDPGRSRVKPALAAVLDKAAESMRRMRFAQMALIAAPADPGAKSSLATRRAERIRRHLRSRGVAAERLARPSTATRPAVQLRIGIFEP